jgi:hypothetical protein
VQVEAKEETRLKTLLWYKMVNRQKITGYATKWGRRCTFCQSELMECEAHDWCRNNGKWILLLLKDYPPTFQVFLNANSRSLQQYGRRLNNLFSFSAIGYTGKHRFGKMPQNVVITGRVYYRMLNRPDEQGSLRWFLYDERGYNDAAYRIGVPDHLIQPCEQLLENHSLYIRNIRYTLTTIDGPSYEIHLQQPVAGGEVAAIVNLYNLQQISGRTIGVSHVGKRRPDFVDILSPMYESLQYPLFFPFADIGWSRRGSYLYSPPRSQSQWYRFRLLREPRFSYFGSLTCEYIVDMYCRIEDERLQYIREARQRQATLMQRIYNNDADLQNKELDATFATALPASFLGSRAWASEKVADALALCRAKGKPNLFVTMTTNPKWPEIQEALNPGQQVADIPMIVCRAFKGRLKMLNEFLTRQASIIPNGIRQSHPNIPKRKDKNKAPIEKG